MEMKYIDLHCDTLMQAFIKEKTDIFRFDEAMVDVSRLKRAGAEAQFFAIFMPDGGCEVHFGKEIPGDQEYIRQLYGIFRNTLEGHPDDIAFAGSQEELRENREAGRISALLTLEDGRAAAGEIRKLEQFYDMGIRLISLTWNNANCFGFPNSTDPAVMEQGLTPFGKEAVRRMEELGMIVDVSHLSDGGFRDVAELLKGPFLASHSNCRELAPHPRNLTDEMLRTIGEHGGVAGLNLYSRFLNKDAACECSRVDDMAAHIRHMVKVGGIECAAIGTDFDGMEGRLEIGNPCQMELLFDRLAREGFVQEEIEKIAYKNARRFLQDVLPECRTGVRSGEASAQKGSEDK